MQPTQGSSEEEKSPTASSEVDVLDNFLKQTEEAKQEPTVTLEQPSNSQEVSQEPTSSDSTISTSIVNNNDPPAEQKIETEEEINLDRIPLQDKDDEEEITLDRIQLKEEDDDDEHTTLERIQLNGDEEGNDLFSNISKQVNADESLPLTVEELVNQFKTEQNQAISYEAFEKLMAQGLFLYCFLQVGKLIFDIRKRRK